MKHKKILKIGAIVLSVLVLLIDILSYIKWHFISTIPISSNDSYEIASSLIVKMFYFGAWVYGLLLLLIVWIEYFLINFIIKLCSKLHGFKETFLILVSLIIAIVLFIFFIKIIVFIFIILNK